MKRLMDGLLTSLSVMAIGTLQAGAVSASAAVEDGSVSFTQAVIPVLRTQCATCHMTGTEPGNLKLYPSAAYDSIVEAKSPGTGATLVVPGNPDSSYLLHKIKGTHLEHGGTGGRMPFGQRPLADDVISVIEKWIDQGALNN
ncbi:hypothetical protein [Pseudomonas profundi]|uniref:hypothetical protein n=1 Tax=Pseudomonas profundi TaxID=1981513 RepID=UPI00123A943F|nr:hypothetical protein [Pseudomonas profundi]